MFTGIIEGTGRVKTIREKENGRQMEISVDFSLEQTNIGESIAVNGCCLTITSRLGNTFWADLSPETCTLTTLGELKPGCAVNLERPLKRGERLGGHIVQGHVDGIGIIKSIIDLKVSQAMTLKVPLCLSKFLVSKGSIAVDGVSLTINECEGDQFSVMIIPHTQIQTSFQSLKPGNRVNLEVDIIGKYVDKLTHLDSEEYQKGTAISREFLKKHGF